MPSSQFSLTPTEYKEEIQYDPTGQISLEDALKYVPAHFEYEWLDGNNAYRTHQKAQFVSDKEYLPFYDYAKMRDRNVDDYVDDLNDETSSASQEIARLVDCTAVIEENRDRVGDETANMYVHMFDVLVGRELLVQASYRAITAQTAETRSVWRNKFMEVNEALYGEIDKGLFLGIMQTEKRRLQDFQPADEAGHKIKKELTPFFDGLETEGRIEPDYIDRELIDEMTPILEKEYGHIFEVLPDTDDSVKYGTGDIVHFMNLSLEAGGLAEKGWVARESYGKTAVSTNTALKVIEVPKGDLRTARQLKALIVHEQEVHARRGQNGLESKAPGLLGNGTANYTDVEEGLGIALECIVNGTVNDNVAVKRARDRYIHVGLALGVGTHKQRDAREVFELAWRIEALKQASKADGRVTSEIINEAKNGKWGSIAHVENIFRGTDFAGKGIIYSKAKVYLEGFTKAVADLRSIDGNVVEFRKRFIGKFDHTDDEEMAFAEKMAA